MPNAFVVWRSSRSYATALSCWAPKVWTLSTVPVTIVHVARDRHQRKQVEEALKFAEHEGCLIEVRHAGHTWGEVVAPNGQRLRVWSTPRNADVAAKMIRRFASRNKKEA